MTSQNSPETDPGYETPEEWAIENAARMAELTARNGVGLTWAEAHQALLAANMLVEVPMFAPTGDAGQYEEIPTLPDGAVGWRDPSFVESVACGRVLFEGKIYVPLNPSASKVEIAIPWGVAGQLTSRLAFVLSCHARVQLPGVDEGEVSTLLANLTFSVSNELRFSADDQEDDAPDIKTLDDERAGGELPERRHDLVEGRCYLLMRSCDVHRSAQILAEAREGLAAVGAGTASPDAVDLEPTLAEFMTDPDLCDEFLWELDRWINPTR